MFVTRHRVSLTTDGSGDATGYTTENIRGVVLGLYYVPDGTAPIAATGDLTVTSSETGSPIFATLNTGSAAIFWVPLLVSHKAEDGVALTADESRKPPVVANERVKFVVANGGAAKSGVLHLYVA